MKDASICGCGEKKYWKYANCNRCYHLKINETLVRRRISECLGDEAVESTRIVNLAAVAFLNRPLHSIATGSQ